MGSQLTPINNWLSTILCRLFAMHHILCLKVAILKELLFSEDRSKGPSSRFLFLHKFRELVKENISETGIVQAQQCSLPVLLALFHRFVRTLRDIFNDKKISTEDSKSDLLQHLMM